MRNAAGDWDSYRYIPQELAEAGIILVDNLDPIPDPEIKTRYTGKLHGWTFRRAWYYWIAHCENDFDDGLEIRYATPMHDLIGQEVRLAGHCGCPSPASNNFLWCKIYSDTKIKYLPQDIWDKNIIDYGQICSSKQETLKAEAKEGYKKFKKEFAPIAIKDIESSNKVAKIVTNSYHIDTQEGLNIFTNVLRKRHKTIEFIKKEEEQKRLNEECQKEHQAELAAEKGNSDDNYSI